jgi:DNA-binding NarL/FixJ family response regulator
MPIRVSLVEDDRRLRESLSELIRGCPDCTLVAAYSSAETALAHLASEPPDVLLMDINLPGISGVDCVRQLRKLPSINPSPEVVMLTVYEESNQIFDALKAGASGYLLKRASPSEILDAILAVHAGGAPMSSHIARKVVKSFKDAGPSTEASENLSVREEEILGYVAQGYINKEIADFSGLSVETVRSYLKNIYKKLHVRSRTAAAMKYFQRE